MEYGPHIIVIIIGLVFFIGISCITISFFVDKDQETMLPISFSINKKSKYRDISFEEDDYDENDNASVIIIDYDNDESISTI